ncbi:MAG: nucleotidyltransferase domain-containing protein [Coxiellaceae bacterium]|nr:nucleotidyltransferase domain-containing protein [Coxiellaceae bacterium]
MLDLKPEHIETVKAILNKHLPGVPVKAFGYRVTGKEKKYSDLDLVIMGEGTIDNKLLNEIKFEFSDSDLPIMVDIIDWHDISDEFKRAIESDCEAL